MGLSKFSPFLICLVGLSLGDLGKFFNVSDFLISMCRKLDSSQFCRYKAASLAVE